MKLKSSIKDWQIAQDMFGTNTKEQCKLIKKLRTKGEVYSICDGWSVISEKDSDECGWIISNDLLENV